MAGPAGQAKKTEIVVLHSVFVCFCADVVAFGMLLVVFHVIR